MDKTMELSRRLDVMEAEVTLAEIVSSRSKAELDDKWKQVHRVVEHCLRENITSARFKAVPGNYYDLSLSARASLLATNVQHLTKAILVENKAFDPDSLFRTNVFYSRYYLVIVQYITRLNSEKLGHVLRAFLGEKFRADMPRKDMKLQHADEKDAVELAGFEHNGISPFGTKNPLPIILSQSILELSPEYLWMGGGLVDVKLGMTVEQLIKALRPLVGDIAERTYVYD